MEATFDTKPYLSQFIGLDVSALEEILKALDELIAEKKAQQAKVESNS